eukprot:m.201594 g.201594  ORF g.201594 m.201594 type:complete len:408 (+) comp21474_c0_seq1:1128-2351(+)
MRAHCMVASRCLHCMVSSRVVACLYPNSRTHTCNHARTRTTRIVQLVSAHWDYLALPASATRETRRTLYDDLAGSISAWGFIWGYIGGLVCLILTIPIAVAIDSEDAFRVNIVLAGCWWFGFSWISIIYLEPRPGPPLPPGQSYVSHSINELKVTVGRLWRLPSTLKFMLCWFGYSDGVAVIAASAVLYANTEVDWGCIPKVLGIGVLLLGTPLLAIIGLVVVDYHTKRHGWEPKWVIIAALGVLLLIPIYGLIGFGTQEAGLRQGWELFILMVFFALPLGVVQSYSRAYFTNIIPTGYESQFFSMFEITDKGSSILSPIIVSQIVANAPFRYVFIYVLLIILLPTLCFIPLDPRLAKAQALAYSEAMPRQPHKHQRPSHNHDGLAVATTDHSAVDVIQNRTLVTAV